MLDSRFPHQAEKHAVEFNAVTAKHILQTYGREENMKIVVLDFMNMTRGAAVSDGFHYLSEVNLIKAMYIFNVMDQFLNQDADKIL